MHPFAMPLRLGRHEIRIDAVVIRPIKDKGGIENVFHTA
jgi:hypothetical protein